jgi:hypothetical protein
MHAQFCAKLWQLHVGATHRHLAVQRESVGDAVIALSFAETLAPLHYAE